MAKKPSERPVPSAPIPLANEEAWDGASGQEFGGSADILQIEVGQVAGPLEYQGHQQITTDLGEATVHTASDEEGNQWRLPIQATFVRAIDQAGMRRGDKFLVKRMDDTIKKRGKGAGNPMSIYAIKIVERGAAEGSDRAF